MQQLVFKQAVPSLLSTLHLQSRKRFLSTERELNRNMRVAIFVSIMLLACCLSVDAWWGRRRRVTARVNVNNGNPSAGATWTAKGDNWESSVHGNIDHNGNWGVGASATWHFKKRSVELQGDRYNVTLTVDECNFDAYDNNRDGQITIEEFYAVFGENEETETFFKDIDTPSGDGVIDQEDFMEMVPLTIVQCEGVDED